jgi:sec-independent protein translocase protein TatA
MPAFIGPIGLPELLIILVIVLLLFGASQIPRLMRGLGQGIHEFKKGVQEGGAEAAKPEEAKPETESKPQDKPPAS